MATYSIIINGDETIYHDLFNINDIESLLDSLKDEGGIESSDIRNMFLSLWGNIAFNSMGDYISSSFSKPILVGNSIYSTNINSDVSFGGFSEDIIDNKISILVGMTSEDKDKSPYFKYKVVVGDNNTYITLDINNTDDINIASDDITIASLLVDFSSVSDGDILMYDDGITLASPIDISSHIGSTNSIITFNGELFINDYDLSFTEIGKIPRAIGDINTGETFSSFPITELLKRILYDYQSPDINLKFEPPFENGYVEVGTNPRPSIKYNINKKTLPLLQTSLVNMNPNRHPPITGDGYITEFGISNCVLVTPILHRGYAFSAVVRDNTVVINRDITLYGIYPFFYGMDSDSSINYLFGLNKIIDGYGSKKIFYGGRGYLYFIYPSEYGELSDITDDSNTSILSLFTQTYKNFSSPNGFWVHKPFIVYKSNVIEIYEESKEFNFIF
jgi:hypothetical protein